MSTNAGTGKDVLELYLEATEEASLAEGWKQSDLEIALDAANYAIFMDNEKLAALVIEYINERFSVK